MEAVKILGENAFATRLAASGRDFLPVAGMVNFAEFLGRAAVQGEFVNDWFEERVFELTETLQRLAASLEKAAVPDELVR
jgi:hypothetical protein